MALGAFFGLASMSCFAQPAFLAVKHTPYDQQMARVRLVLTSAGRHSAIPVSLLRVNEWMQKLYAIPYGTSRQWKTPAEVESASVADCKDKAIALYQKMRTSGAKNVRFVIGKRRPGRLDDACMGRMENAKRNYVLDPTFYEMPVKAAQTDVTSYVPFYAYEGARKYRAAHMTLAARD